MLITLLLLGASLLLVLCNAFFVASEFAIVKIRPTRLAELVQRGDGRARRALGISRRLDAYLSANQLGITLASLALGWLGEPAFADLLRPLFAALGPAAEAVSHTIAVTLAFILITFLHTVLGELAPKSLAIQRTEPVALWTALPLQIFYWLAYPLIWTLNASARLVLRLCHLRPADALEMRHSPEELRLVLRGVELDPGARGLMDRVFDYTHRIARHVMTLRPDVVVLETGWDWERVMDLVLSSQYTRYPLLDSATGRVLGYVHLKDLFGAVVRAPRPPLQALVREPIYATEETPLEELRRAFQRRRVHLAVIRDAGGSFTGIVTLEDLLEEFVGEIQDEQDIGEVPPLVREADGSFEADARVTLDVAMRELGLGFSEVPPGVETLGAWVMSRLGRTPRVGDTLEAGGFRIKVAEVRERRVRRLRGARLEPPAESESGPEEDHYQDTT